MQGLPHAGGPWAAPGGQKAAPRLLLALRGGGAAAHLLWAVGTSICHHLRVRSSLSLAGLLLRRRRPVRGGSGGILRGPRENADKTRTRPLRSRRERSFERETAALASRAGRHNHSRAPARPPDKTEPTHGRPLRRHRDPEQRRRPVSTPRINQIAARHAIDATPAQWHDVTG